MKDLDKLIGYLAWKYSGGNKVLQKDLVQVGYIALQKAEEQFKTERGVQFSTYAFWKIRGYMLNYLRKLRKELDATLDSEVENWNEEGELTSVVENASDKDEGLTPEERVLLEDYIDCLNERQRRIITLRYGLFEERAHTLKEIAQMEGCTTQRIEGILKMCILKMRKHIKGGENNDQDNT